MISRGACLCDPDPEERLCSMHTRLRVMLEDVPGLGVWRVDTGSYYAAVELPGIAAILSQAQGIIPGRLILDQRTVTRQVDGQPKTMNFVVPVLDIAEFTPGQLASGKVQELIAARRAAAIEGQVRAEIEAAPPDYPSLIEAAKTVEALHELYQKAEAKGEATSELLAAFQRKADAIRAAQPQADVVEATVVDPSPGAEPAGVGDGLDELWHQVLEASPWDDADELERNFCQIVGRSSDEATADDMRKFLGAVERAKAGVSG